MKKTALFLALAIVFVAGCDESTTPVDDSGNHADVIQDNGTPDTNVPDGNVTDEATTDVTTGSCIDCLAAGQTYLFKSLNVTEPSTPMELPNLLNGIWSPDIVDYRLNIMMKIEEVTPRDDGGLLVKARAGSAWHNLPFADVEAIGHGLTPDAFYFNIMDLTTIIYFQVDAQCNFQTIDDPQSGEHPKINFRPGPVDRYLICSGGNEALDLPANSVPIRMMVATGKFNNTCTKMTDGSLAGCISKNAACEICDFLTAPDYSLWDSVTPDPSVTPVDCEPSYCENHCGGMPWTNFGGVVVGFGVPLNCDMDGDSTNDGFRIVGTFDTSTVPLVDTPAN